VLGERPLTVLFLLFLLSPVTEMSAQQCVSQSIDVPVVLTRMDTYTDPTSQKIDTTRQREDLVKDFGLDNFQVRVGGSEALVQSAVVDKGPKRVVFVLDATKLVDEKGWGRAIGTLKKILLYARKTDMFAFVFAGADAPTNTFLSLSEAKGLLEKLRNARQVTAVTETRIYDALLEGAKRLQPPQFGDVVIFGGRVVDSGSNTTLSDLIKVFVKNRIRFIGLNETRSETYVDFDSRTLPFPGFSVPKLADLSDATGYFIWGANSGWESAFLRDIIAEPYRLTICTPARPDPAVLDIKLVPGSKKKKVEGIIFHFPRYISP